MSSKPSTVDFLADQMAAAGTIRSRKMFGEYALYCNENILAFVCDDQLFVKPTVAGRASIKTPIEAPVYPGLRNYLLIEGDSWDDRVAKSTY